MNTLARKIALSIKRSNAEQTASVEVMQYSLAIMLNTLLIIVSTALLGWLLGVFAESMLVFAAFALLRFFSGGFHLRSATACNIISTALCVGLALAADAVSPALLYMNVFSLVIMLFFSPNPDANTQIPVHLHPMMKGLSLLLVALNFFIQSPVIGLAFLAQSLTVIPWERRMSS